MRDIIGRLRESPGWAISLLFAVGGVYMALTGTDWALGAFATLLFLNTLYILRLEAYIAELKASE